MSGRNDAKDPVRGRTRPKCPPPGVRGVWARGTALILQGKKKKNKMQRERNGKRYLEPGCSSQSSPRARFEPSTRPLGVEVVVLPSAKYCPRTGLASPHRGMCRPLSHPPDQQPSRQAANDAFLRDNIDETSLCTLKEALGTDYE